MSNSKTLEVKFDDDKIFVRAKIHFEKPVSFFSFSLNKHLIITSLFCDGLSPEVSKNNDKHLQFRAAVTEYILSSSRPWEELILEYEGVVNGWNNIIEGNRRALSMYSAWFPSGTSVELDDALIHILCCENYHVIKGRYESETKIWNYGKKGYDDCNIIALKKGQYQQITVGDLNIYYLVPSDQIGAELIGKHFNKIMKYYLKLFGITHSIEMDIVSLATNTAGGSAYFRKDLIVFDSFGSPDDFTHLNKLTVHVLGHELAHLWCKGAKTSEWNDWMNEGTAEWSSMIYALENGEKDVFDERLKYNLDYAKDKPAIRTKDGRRIAEIHAKATSVLYPVYRDFGVDKMKEILQIYAAMDYPKTTELFLFKISEQLGTTIANLIEEGLSC